MIRLDYDPDAPALMEQVKRLLREAIGGADLDKPSVISDQESVWEYLHRRDLRLVDPLDRPIAPVLVIDQFEEVFRLGLAREQSRSECKRFLLELTDLLENRPPASLKARIAQSEEQAEGYTFGRKDYRVVLSLREDYLVELSGLVRRAPSLRPNRMRVTRMTGEQALEAVLEPAKGLVTQEIAVQIVQFLGGTRTFDLFGDANGEHVVGVGGLEVDPALLSLFCSELNERRLERGLPQITPPLLAEARQEILQSFYERALKGQPPELRAFVEDELLSETGVRENMSLEKARQELAEKGVPANALDEVVNRRLLRVEERGGVSRVELVHDVFADIVKESRSARRRRDAEAKSAALRREAEARIAAEKRKLRWRTAAVVIAVFVVGGFSVSWYLNYIQVRHTEAYRSAAQSYARGLPSIFESVANIRRGQRSQQAMTIGQIVSTQLMNQSEFRDLLRAKDSLSYESDSSALAPMIDLGGTDGANQTTSAERGI